MSGNPTPLSLEDPLGVDDARHALHLIANRRRTAREALKDANDKLAVKERDYRKARATAYVRHAEAPSAGARDAQVDSDTADARYERDVARGVLAMQQELLSEIDAERASLHRLIDWSMRLDPFAAEERPNVRSAA